MEFNQPRPGEINPFYEAGKEFMKRSLAFANPILDVRLCSFAGVWGWGNTVWPHALHAATKA